jgi:hypothetical protein
LSWTADIGLFAYGKLKNSIFPAFDYSEFTNSEGNWLSSWNRGIKDITIRGKGASIVNFGSLTGLALIASSLLENINSYSTFEFLLSKVLW